MAQRGTDDDDFGDSRPSSNRLSEISAAAAAAAPFLQFLTRDPTSDSMEVDSTDTFSGNTTSFMPVLAGSTNAGSTSAVGTTGGRGTKRKATKDPHHFGGDSGASGGGGGGGKGKKGKDVIIPDVSGRGGKRRDAGLRTLCFRICSILQELKRLTFENLVFLLHGDHDADKKFRRRVYDTMKVLKATEVIDIDEDEDREVVWKGLSNDVVRIIFAF
jgi:hypothetical protein